MLEYVSTAGEGHFITQTHSYYPIILSEPFNDATGNYVIVLTTLKLDNKVEDHF